MAKNALSRALETHSCLFYKIIRAITRVRILYSIEKNHKNILNIYCVNMQPTIIPRMVLIEMLIELKVRRATLFGLGTQR